ncbi:transcription factor SPT20 homolog isoform X1 [Polypterus senegalus]|uniref:transcription factor SPT20 homolog isoform X1 n=1 Tax=Polypterus senegalus TaxID=55291 RepID=UPI00196530E2|nr:transcription factor SPT20 homolog isoform X1 [Polypterus senegalus]
MPALLNISSYIVPCHQIKMKQVLEHALDRAEYIVESAQQRPPKRRNSTSARKSLNQKLYDLYLEECEKEPEIKKLRRNVNLLEKLVMQETLSCLVVNLYPGNEGYSLMLRGKNGTDSETIRLPYEECELLDYLDAEELPPILVDLLEKSQVNIFHCGCVIAEIRDYRQTGNTKVPTYKTRHILLRPTMQTLVCDVHAITSDNHKWTQDDKLLLESHLILATAEPLCLDPSISVTCTVNRLLYNKQKMNTYSMKRCFKRFSRPSLNRRLEMANYPTPPQLKLFDYIQKRKERKISQSVDLKISRAGNCVDMWKQNSCLLLAPTELDVEKYATVEKSVKLEESQPSVWPAHDIKDDYIFECEVGAPFPKTKVTIYQCAGDPLFYGKIQVAKDLSRDDENDFHLIHPPFLIGSKIDADRFIKQYKDVYHKDAKCPIKMSHNSGGSANHGQLSPSKEAEPDGISGSVQSSVLGKGVKHRPPPIKLPSGSGSNSSANAYSSQQSGSHLKSPTPPPSKSQSLSRKHSELNQVNLLSPSALSPVGSSQRSRGGGAYPGSNVRKAGLHHGRDASPSQGSGTPKPSTPTPTNTPSSTPHPPDIQTSTPSITPSATPTPQDSSMNSQPALLTSFAQQQMALSQTLPVMTIPLATMGTSITTGTSTSQVMTSPAGLNFINVVGSVCAPQMMSGSNPMLGCNPGTITSTGINLSGILPSGGLVPGALPTMQSGAQAGVPFGLKNASGLRPLNLLQIPGGPLIFNSLQQQQLSQFSPQQSSTQSATSSPQQQSDQSSDQGPSSQDQTLSGQQTAVINLGGFMSPHSVAILTTPNASANGYGGSSGPGSSNPSSFKQPTKK